MPVCRAITGTIRVNLIRRHHTPALRNKQITRKAEFPQIIQLYPDRVTIQPATSGPSKRRVFFALTKWTTLSPIKRWLTIENEELKIENAMNKKFS